MGYAPPQDIHPAVRELIRHKARRLAGRYGFTPGDREDLEQELALHVLAKGPLYDPSRASPAAFFGRVVERRAMDLARAAVAAERDPRRIEQADVEQLPAAGQEGAAERTDLKLDVADAVRTLEPKLRTLALALMAESPAEVARKAGRTRGEVRHACSTLAKRMPDLHPGGVARRSRRKIIPLPQPFRGAAPYIPCNRSAQCGPDTLIARQLTGREAEVVAGIDSL